MTFDPTLTNTAFELVGSCLAVHNVRVAAKTKPAGVSLLLVGFSAVWAANTITYYAGHGEALASVCAAVRCLSWIVWLVFALAPRSAADRG